MRLRCHAECLHPEKTLEELADSKCSFCDVLCESMKMMYSYARLLMTICLFTLHS